MNHSSNNRSSNGSSTEDEGDPKAMSGAAAVRVFKVNGRPKLSFAKPTTPSESCSSSGADASSLALGRY